MRYAMPALLIFLLWRVVVAIAVGFMLMLATALLSGPAGWSLAHGGFIVVWPLFSAFALFGLLRVNARDLWERAGSRLRSDRG